jgi:S1-C subfamily serine protease
VGVGFAVPVNTVKKYFDTMVAGGQVQHPRVGIMGWPLTQRLAEQLELSLTRGIYVLQVTAGGPGDAAGLRGAFPSNRQVPTGLVEDNVPRGGDVITAIDGQPVTKIANVAEYIELKKKVGDSVALTVKRGTEDLTLNVKLDAWPAE